MDTTLQFEALRAFCSADQFFNLQCKELRRLASTNREFRNKVQASQWYKFEKRRLWFLAQDKKQKPEALDRCWTEADSP